MKRTLKTLAAALAVVVAGLGVALERPDLPVAELEARYAGDASRFVELLGLRVHYRDEGTGPPLLLLHGTASSLHTWDGWVRELRGDFRLLRLDLPAFGLTGPERDHDYSEARRTDVMVALLDHLGVGRCSVAGNSLGGFLAWQLAVRHPERVDRLVLIDAAGYPEPRPGGKTVMDLGRIRGLRGVLSRLTPRFLIAAGVRESYGDPARLAPEVIDRYWELLRRPGNREALLVELNRPRPEEHGAIKDLRHPTLVMWGREDRLIKVDFAERFHRDLPDSELVIYDGVGHVPMEEIPARSADDARAFLLAGAASEPG